MVFTFQIKVAVMGANMREIKYIVAHTTATPTDTTIESIKRYWENVLGWKNPGYHFIIKYDGTIVNLMPIDQVSNGVAGYNSNSIHIAYIGGQFVDDRSDAQKEAMLSVIRTMRAMFPTAQVLGHRDFPNVKKACPRFDAIAEYKNIKE